MYNQLVVLDRYGWVAMDKGRKLCIKTFGQFLIGSKIHSNITIKHGPTYSIGMAGLSSRTALQIVEESGHAYQSG